MTEDYFPLTLGDGSVAVGSAAVGSGERHFQRLFTPQAKAKSMPKHRVFGNHGRDEDGKQTRTVHSPGGNTRVGMQTFNTTPNGINEAWLFYTPGSGEHGPRFLTGGPGAAPGGVASKNGWVYMRVQGGFNFYRLFCPYVVVCH